MNEAFRQALIAYEKDEIPVGAIVVANNRIIARAYNQVETLKDATAHAEMLALTSAENYLSAKYLSNCTLYVTLEPCIMCAGAALWTQVGKLVFAARDPQRGFRSYGEKILHPKTNVVAGVMENECEELLVSFFKKMRS